MNAPIRTEVDADFHEADDRLNGLMEALFHPTGVPGVYGRKGVYEDVVERLAAFITTQREEGTEMLRFPPVMSRRTLERSGYLKSFPNLLGCMCALGGTMTTSAPRSRPSRRAATGRSLSTPATSC